MAKTTGARSASASTPPPPTDHVPRPHHLNPITIRLKEVDEVVSLVYQGRKPSVVVSGPPGIGKTHKCEEVSLRYGRVPPK